MSQPNQFSMDVWGFEGSLNDIQQAYTESRRARIQAEIQLNAMEEGNEWKVLQAGIVSICHSWEDKLLDDLWKALPKEQTTLVKNRRGLIR